MKTFLLVLVAFYFSTMAQIDTVYEYGSPVIIKKKVFLEAEEVVKPRTWFLSIGGGLGSIASQNHNDSIRLSFGKASQLEMTLRKAFGKFEIGTGIAFLSTQAKTLYQHSYWLDKERNIVINDTLDVYYEVVNGDSIPVYIVEPKPGVEWYRETMDTTYARSSTVYYLQVPLSVSYRMAWKSWYMSPGFGVLVSIPLRKPELVTEVAKSTPKSTVWGSMALSVGRRLGERWRAELSAEGRRSMAPTSDLRAISSQRGLLLGFKVLYAF